MHWTWDHQGYLDKQSAGSWSFPSGDEEFKGVSLTDNSESTNLLKAGAFQCINILYNFISLSMVFDCPPTTEQYC